MEQHLEYGSVSSISSYCKIGQGFWYTLQVKKYEYHGIRSVCVYGGGSIGEQLRAIEAGTGGN